MNKNTRGAATNPASSVTPEYLDAFHQMLPELFDEKPLPNNWEDGVVLIPSGGALSSDIEEDGVERILFPELLVEPQSPANLEFNSEPEFPDLSDWNPLEWPAKARFPGAPENAPPKGQFPSTDVLAFYLPFHYFYPDAWGVYIFVEGVQRVAVWGPAAAQIQVPIGKPVETLDMEVLIQAGTQHVNEVVMVLYKNIEFLLGKMGPTR